MRRYQPLNPDDIGVIPVAKGSLISVDRVRLVSTKGNIELTVGADTEGVLHILTGTSITEVSGPWGRRTLCNLGERMNVFSGLPTSVAVKPFSRIRLESSSRYLDCLWVTAKVEKDLPAVPSVIRHQDVQVHEIGEGYSKRIVRECVGGLGITTNLRVGETISPVGCWSSWPHHEFDTTPNVSDKFEEFSLYFTRPKEGYGIQIRRGKFSDGRDVDDVFVFRNGESCLIPLGYHPVVSGPESETLYVWAYVSPIPKKYAKFADDVGGYQ